MFLSLAALTTEAFPHQGRRKKSGTVSVPREIFRELRFAFLRKLSHIEKRQKKNNNNNNKQKQKNIFTVFLLSSSQEITGKELKKSV